MEQGVTTRFDTPVGAGPERMVEAARRRGVGVVVLDATELV
jgi:hypothetical protein